jgi:hypothetical protein
MELQQKKPEVETQIPLSCLLCLFAVKCHKKNKKVPNLLQQFALKCYVVMNILSVI